ncbi:MAG TPA: LLM class flavin-dependent oxidoreductase, partial [Acetobacteraceae bacterium]
MPALSGNHEHAAGPLGVAGVLADFNAEGLCGSFTCDWRTTMKISAMIRVDPAVEPHDRMLSRMADYARRIEASGFPGIWVGDSLGRGRPTLDPLIELSVLAAVTERVELGISVLQLPLRHPIELAHRVQSVQA